MHSRDQHTNIQFYFFAPNSFDLNGLREEHRAEPIPDLESTDLA